MAINDTSILIALELRRMEFVFPSEIPPQTVRILQERIINQTKKFLQEHRERPWSSLLSGDELGGISGQYIYED